MKKRGEWRQLHWVAGQSPVVTQECELERLFQFVAPKASFSVFDRDGYFRKGGSYEIMRGDDVMVEIADPTGKEAPVEIFRGYIAMGVESRYNKDVITFNGFGYLAALKGIRLGMPGRTRNDTTLWGRNLSVDPWRWEKTIQDEDGIDWIYHVWQQAYDDMRESEKLGYRKVYPYYTRGKAYPHHDLEGEFGLEYKQRYIWESVRGEDERYGVVGVYRRRAKIEKLSAYATDYIVKNIIVQVNRVNSGHRVVFRPGEIDISFDVRIIDEAFDEVDIFTRKVNDQQRVYCAGWNYNYSGDGSTAPSIKLFDVTNVSQIDEIGVFNFMASLKWVKDMQKELEASGYEINNGYFDIYHVRKRVGTDKVIFYVLYGWIEYKWESSNLHKWIRRCTYEWMTIDLKTEEIKQNCRVLNQGNELFIKEYTPEGYKSIGIDFEKEYFSKYEWTEGGTLYRILPELSIIQDPVSNRELTISGSRYYTKDNVPFVLGIITTGLLVFDFKNVYATEVLKEICKLTDSILTLEVEGNERVVYLVSREWYRDVHDLPKSRLQGTVISNNDYLGERRPDLRSEIVQNESIIDAIEIYYGDKYLSESVEIWKMRYLESLALARVKMLDGVRFAGVYGKRPAIVRRMVWNRQGEVEITASKGLDLSRESRGV